MIVSIICHYEITRWGKNLLGHNVLKIGEIHPIFQNSLLPSSSGHKYKSNKESARIRQQEASLIAVMSQNIRKWNSLQAPL
jgi:hypothetical protein